MNSFNRKNSVSIWGRNPILRFLEGIFFIPWVPLMLIILPFAIIYDKCKKKKQHEAKEEDIEDIVY